MASASPSRSSPSLDRYLRHGSGSKGSRRSHSQTIYGRIPTKPKKLQSAHYDETTGTWRCKHCGYTYPNAEPHHHQRRAHKKICPGELGKVHSWLSLSTGEETEDSRDTSTVVDKPTTPETSESATTQHALGKQDGNAGLQAPQLLDRELKLHGTPSSNDLPSESEIQELGDPRKKLSDQDGLVEAGENSEARRKVELDSKPATEKDFKPRTGDPGRLLTLDSDFSLPLEMKGLKSLSGDLGRLLTLDSDFSLPHEMKDLKSLSGDLGRLRTLDSNFSLPHGSTQSISDQVDLSGVGSSDFAQAADDSADGSKDGMDIGSEEHPSRSSKSEAYSPKAGADVLTAHDALKERTEVAQGEHSTPSSDEIGPQELATEELGEAFDQREPSSNAADDDIQDKTADALQQVDKSQTTATEDQNVQVLRANVGEEFDEMDAILPSATDDGAVVEEKEEIGSERGIITISGDGSECKSEDEQESPEMVTGVEDEEASQHAISTDGSSHIVYAAKELDDVGGHAGTGDANTISLEPLSDDAERVSEAPPNANGAGLPVRLSSAERNWDDWEHVVSADDTSGNDEMPPLPQEIDDAGPPFAEDGSVSSRSGNVEGDTADKNAPTLESKGGAILTSAQDDGHQVGFQPAGLDWTLAFPDTVKDVVDRQQPVDSLDGSTVADYRSSPVHDGQELIPGLDQETAQTHKVVLRLSAAEANWDDWEDVIKRGPMLMEGLILRKTQDPESSRECQTPAVDYLGDVSDPGQGKTERDRMSRTEDTSPVLESALVECEHENELESPSRSDSDIVDSDSSAQAGLVEHLKTPPVASNSDGTAINSGQEIDGLSKQSIVTSVSEEADHRFLKAELEPNDVSSYSFPKDLGPREGREGVDDNEGISRYESVQAGVNNLWDDDWEVVEKNEYPPAGSRHSSPSFEDAHDGELSSDHEYPTGLPTAVNLPLGTRRWADWADLTKSEYMVLDGPDGESLVFKRTSEARDKVSAKALGGGGDMSPSFEEPDVDGGSPSLRRRRRQAPSFDGDKTPSFRSGKGASPRGVVKSEYSAGSNSFQGFETTPKSLPASSPRKSETGDLAPLVTRRPLIYRGSRRDVASEVEDEDVTSEPPLGQHLHHHNYHEHEDALKYDVEKVLRGQTTYELICPICGALITRKIIIRKKKRRFLSEGDSRWRRGATEITPVEDNGNRSPRSDISSEIEDVTGAWKQGIRPCFGYFFGS